MVLRHVGMAEMALVFFRDIKMILALTFLRVSLMAMRLNVIVDTTDNGSGLISELSWAVIVVDKTIERILFLELSVPVCFLFCCFSELFHVISSSCFDVIIICVRLLCVGHMIVMILRILWILVWMFLNVVVNTADWWVSIVREMFGAIFVMIQTIIWIHLMRFHFPISFLLSIFALFNGLFGWSFLGPLTRSTNGVSLMVLFIITFLQRLILLPR